MSQKHHESGQSHSEIKTSSDRSFGMVFGLVFFLLAIHSLWRETSTWPLYALIAPSFVLVGLFRPAVLAPFNRAWTRLGLMMGKIVSPVVLGALFFLVIAPIGVVFRWMGKDLLNLRRDPQVTTYWLIRDPPGPAPESIDDQF